jgi:lipopolysaccharide/colanic/teichoic acid biosynthesis glycosyltransferase
MVVDAPDVRTAEGLTYSSPDDPRVTPVGRVLRRWSVDELPQLWNVLKGDMSLVGPRPDLPDQTSLYDDDDWERLSVRPGLTGLAQSTLRSAASLDARKRLDLEYVRGWSYPRDLGILFRTIPSVLLGANVNRAEAAAPETGER